ncbi:aldo/keto reductase [Paenibacillus hodogayensis]|uniref:Aldo/keto reductase n=1 Tax=Paenibacillus hodogayensis TaxID=279208 RepID=A0ABV5W8C1_9BACL
MEYTTLGRTGLKVSRLGLGGAPLAGGFGQTDPGEVQRMIHEALDAGITFIDTAPLYGKGESEKRIGEALVGRRDRVVLATKAATSDRIYDYETVYQSVEDSLRRLQTDWVDVLQLHDVETQSFDRVMNEAVPALDRLRREGKVRHIGVSTRKLSLLERYMHTGVFDTIQFYVRYMLIDHTAKDAVIPLAERLNIGVINGSVLGMGLLADSPASFMQKDIVIQAQERMERIAFLRRTSNGGLIEPGMRFSLGHPGIAVTLTGAENSEVIRRNVQFCDGRGLAPEEQEAVYKLFDREALFPDRPD